MNRVALENGRAWRSPDPAGKVDLMYQVRLAAGGPGTPASPCGGLGEPTGPPDLGGTAQDLREIMETWGGITGPLDAIRVPLVAFGTGTAIAVGYGAVTL
jgi:hypothetical protein